MTILTYAQALNEALREEMRADPRVFLMGEDIGLHGGIFRVTKDLQAEIVARVYEQAPEALVVPARRLGAKHVPIPVAEPLETAVLPQTADIVRLVEDMI